MKIYLKIVDEKLAEKEKKVKDQQKQVDLAQKQVDAATQEVFQRKKIWKNSKCTKCNGETEVRYWTTPKRSGGARRAGIFHSHDAQTRRRAQKKKQPK